MTTRDFSGFTERYGWPKGKQKFPHCIGHRGASGDKTESTLAAFQLASELGAEMWELDTQLTSDGVVVVSYDDHLLRVFGVDKLYELSIDYRRMGAAAIGLVRVADGIADLYYERHLNGWDMLAGALIAHEAGADVYMPTIDASLGDGGPIIAAAAGLKDQFAFLRQIVGASCQPI